MTIDILNENGAEFPFDAAALLNDVIRKVLETEHCPFEIQTAVSFVGDDEIRVRNREFRQNDSVTDVLSFPLVPFPEPSSFGFLDTADGRECFDPDTGELCLGDIVLNTVRAGQQAEQYGHSIRREIAFLTAHSLLHLLGYDHETEDEAVVMEEKQESVLLELGITRN